MFLWTPAVSESSVTATGQPGVFALNCQAQNTTSLPIFLGAQFDISTELGGRPFSAWLRAAWVHEFNTYRGVSAGFAVLPGTSFAVDGAKAASDAARFDLGVKDDVGSQTSLFLNGSTELSWRGASLAARRGCASCSDGEASRVGESAMKNSTILARLYRSSRSRRIAGRGEAQIAFQTLQFQNSPSTGVTGMRGDNITGSYSFPGGTGGLLYRLSTGASALARGHGQRLQLPRRREQPALRPDLRQLAARVPAPSPATGQPDRSYIFDSAAAPGSNTPRWSCPAPSTPSPTASSATRWSATTTPRRRWAAPSSTT